MVLSEALVIVFNLTLGKEDRIAVFSYQLRFNPSPVAMPPTLGCNYKFSPLFTTLIGNLFETISNLPMWLHAPVVLATSDGVLMTFYSTGRLY